jgi:hypothetical protein
MAYNQIKPVRLAGVLKSDYVECDEADATHWYISIGFDGNDGHLILPSRKAAEACMEHFVITCECGTIG